MQQAVGWPVFRDWQSEMGLRKNRVTLPSRLFHDQHTCRSVPRIEVKFPEALEPSRGNIAEIERRRSRPSHAMRTQSELVIKINIRILVPLLAGKAGRDQTLSQTCRRRDVNRSRRSVVRPPPFSAANISSRVGS